MTDPHGHVVLNFDGAANPNYPVTSTLFSTTRTAYGFVVKSASGQVLRREGGFLGNGTSNTAELQACLLGLTWCLQNRFRRVKVLGDSRNVLAYLTGRYRIPRHHPHLAKLLHEISLVLAVESVPAEVDHRTDVAHDRKLRPLASDPSRVVAVEIKHVPRSQNWEPDRLAEQALDSRSIPPSTRRTSSVSSSVTS